MVGLIRVDPTPAGDGVGGVAGVRRGSGGGVTTTVVYCVSGLIWVKPTPAGDGAFGTRGCKVGCSAEVGGWEDVDHDQTCGGID